jgi:DNA helicase-2/ATP-dependent DNA helicase PcrA
MHKVFGRGKKIRFVPPDKFQVNFPGFGVKTILAYFLTPAE